MMSIDLTTLRKEAQDEELWFSSSQLHPQEIAMKKGK